MAKQPEGRLVRKIRAYLEDRGALVVKIHGGDNPFQERGIADLLVCYRGIFIALEVKQPGKSASPAQEVFLRKVRASGGYAAEVSSVEDVAQLLRSVDHGAKRRVDRGVL